MWTLVAILATVCIERTLAVDQCCLHPEWPCRLREIKDCDSDGQPPDSQVGYGGGNFTLTHITKGDLPRNVTCVVGRQVPGKGLVYLRFCNGETTELTYMQQAHEDYIWEKDQKDIEYKIRVFQNDPIYAYVRCITTNGVNGTGTPMFAIYVPCGHEKDPEVKKATERALKCAKKLNITNIERITPCEGCGSK